MADRADQDRRNRKTRDRAGVLSILAVLLVLPPVVNMVLLEGRVLGLPFTLVYIFGVWAMLIGLAASLSRGLLKLPEMRSDDGMRD